MVVVFTLGAACMYALASVLQHRAASEVPPEHSLRLSLLRRLVARPVWLGGMVADLGGFAFEAAALAIGSLALVQPLMTLGLPLALAGAVLHAKKPMGRREWTAAGVLTLGLAVFLLLATPSHGHDFARRSRWIEVSTVIVAVTALSLGIAVVPRWSRWRALFLAVATGMVFTLSAALTKSVATLVQRHVLGALNHWETYALIVVGLVSMLLGQSAFHGGDLRDSLPAITLVPPLAGTIVGWVLFDERVHATPVTLPIEILAALAAVAATVQLAHSPLAEQAYAPPPPSPSPPSEPKAAA